MKASVTWRPSDTDLTFDCSMDDGKSLILDGNNEHLTPMQTVLMSIGACSSVDVVEILRKARRQIKGCTCELSAIRAESAPRVFKSVNAHFRVTGIGLKDKHVARAVDLSTQKYCSVMLMLTATVSITSTFEIIDAKDSE